MDRCGWRAAALPLATCLGLLGLTAAALPPGALAAADMGGRGVFGAAAPTSGPGGTPRLPAGAVARPACGPVPAGRERCFALTAGRAGSNRPLVLAAPYGYGPASLWSAYRLPAATGGHGQTVAVVDAYGDPAAAGDLTRYRAAFHLPPCTPGNGCLRTVNQHGAASPLPTPDPGWATEISLDLDMVSAVCPNCHILLVEANSDQNSDLAVAEQTALSLRASEVSDSWGGPESTSDPAVCAADYNHPGVPLVAATGDFGYGVQAPAACPGVVAVGGTSLYKAPGTARGWVEHAWSGAGSGCSAREAKPPWQSDPGCRRRTVADVSAVADLNTGVAVYDSYPSGGWEVAGGTSVATPIIAAGYALPGSPPPGAAAASLYANRWALDDVVGGSNGGCPAAASYLCQAVPGYDGPTGLGAPAGVAAFVMPPQPRAGWSPALVAEGGGALLLLDAGRRLELQLTSRSGGSWRSTVAAGGILAAAPGGALVGAGSVEAFARGTDGALWTTTVGGGASGRWAPVGGVLTGAPAAASPAAGVVQAFARGADGALWTTTHTAAGWSGWTSLGGRLAAGGGVGAAADGAGGLTVVVRGPDGHAWARLDGAGRWGPWTDLGGHLLADPAVAPVAGPRGGVYPGSAAVFVAGSDGALWWRQRSPGGWSGWSRLGGALTGGPAAATDATTGSTTVVAAGRTGSYWERTGPLPRLGGWSSLP